MGWRARVIAATLIYLNENIKKFTPPLPRPSKGREKSSKLVYSRAEAREYTNLLVIPPILEVGSGGWY